MDFENWFEHFSKRTENLTEQSLKDMLKLAYTEGFKRCEREMPLYAKGDDGTIIEVPREDNESLLPEGEKWCDEDVDLESWLENKNKDKNGKNETK